MKKYFFLVALSLIYRIDIFAQFLQIVDSESKQPVVNVFVYNDDQSKVQLSNSLGQVDLSLFDGEEEIMFEHVSYKFVFHRKNFLIKGSLVLYLSRSSDLLPEVVLSLTNKETDINSISEKIAILTRSKIDQSNTLSTPDLLATVPGVAVQKSQLGGGSPVIRGFEANRILLVIDGIRLNNAIYRSGHLQNALTVDQFSIERAEIIFGPSSIKYGSDALGGVVHFYTKKPALGPEYWKANFESSYASANNGFLLHGDAIYANENFGTYTSFSMGSFDDLRMGKVRKHGFQDWGKIFTYSNNTDHYFQQNPAVNDNPNIQRNSGYNQGDIIQKFVYGLDAANELEVNMQYSTSSNIPRYDVLTEASSKSGLKWAEWYYGPQDRLLLSASLKGKYSNPYVKNSNIIFAYQNVKESRMQRRFLSLDKTFRYEDVDVYSLNADFSTDYRDNIISYGAELSHNRVSSYAEGKTLNVIGNEIVGFTGLFPVQTRYPDGGSSYTTFAGYFDLRKFFANENALNLGIRYTATNITAKWKDNTFITLPQMHINLNNQAVTASVGFSVKQFRNWVIKAHISSAFRSPNVDDIGKIREKSGLLSVPNTSLTPEYAVNGDISVTRLFLDQKLAVNIDVFYTRIYDLVLRQDYSINGKDSMAYDGVNYKTIANVNSGQAHVYGANVDVRAKISPKLLLLSNLSYTKGWALDQNLPMPSITPIFGSTVLRYERKKWIFELSSVYNGRKKAEDFDIYGGVDNLDLAASPNYGTPWWYTINSKVSYKISQELNVNASVENILDHHYMPFAAGISAPGRNLVLTLRASI